MPSTYFFSKALEPRSLFLVNNQLFHNNNSTFIQANFYNFNQSIMYSRSRTNYTIEQLEQFRRICTPEQFNEILRNNAIPSVPPQLVAQSTDIEEGKFLFCFLCDVVSADYTKVHQSHPPRVELSNPFASINASITAFQKDALATRARLHKAMVMQRKVMALTSQLSLSDNVPSSDHSASHATLQN